MADTLQAIDLEALLDRGLRPDEVLHGVHMECQYGLEHPIATCGAVLDWLDLDETSTTGLCVPCYAEPCHCPVCGVHLEPWSNGG